MILLVPIILFLLGLPNKGPTVEAGSFKPLGASNKEMASYAGFIAMGPLVGNQWVSVAGMTAEEPARKIDFQVLEQAALRREAWDGKTVSVVGQFRPNVQSQREFSLMRFRIKCCAADAIPLDVPIVCKEPVVSVPPMQWIQVTGQIEIQKREGSENSYMTVLRVPSRSKIKVTEPDANPYLPQQ